MATPHAPRDRASSAGDAGEGGSPRAETVLTPEHLARLLELSRALAGACEHAEIAAIAAERARALTGAHAVQVAGRQGGGALAVLARVDGAAPPSEPGAATRLRRGAPEHEVLRSGEPTWIGKASEPRSRGALEALDGGPGGASWAFLPLAADGATSGVLTLTFDEVQAFDDAARAFLREIAAACGAALARGSLFTRERARADASEKARAAFEVRQRRCDGQLVDRTHLFERERFARARAEAETVVAVHLADDLERVQPLTAALVAAESAHDVVRAIVEHGRDAFGALGVELTRRDLGAGTPTPRAAGTAEAEVFRGGVTLWLDAKELGRRFPDSAAALLARGAGSWLGVPVPGGGGVAAVLSVAFPRERAFTPGDRARLALLANECASVLARCTARDAGAAATGGREAAAATPPAAFVVQCEETGVDGPVTRVLGVFSSETSAREALCALDRARCPLVHASITSWTADVAGPLTSIEIDLA